MLICVMPLIVGCVQKPTGNFCDVASPIYFPEALFDLKDRKLIEDITTHNEIWFNLCKK